MILYIDATAGGMMLQILLTGLVGGLVMFKLAAGRIFNAIFRRGSATADIEEPAAAFEVVSEADGPEDGDESESIAA